MNRKPDPDLLAQAITDSAQQIWSAGIDALSLAEKESSRLFENLARLSENIQSHTVNTAKVAKMTVTGGKNTATETWDKLEKIFELRVSRALNALQIPTARDIKELTARVNHLSAVVEQLKAKEVAVPKVEKRASSKKKPGARKKSPTRTTKKIAKKKTKKTSKKTARKKKTAKKSPAKKRKTRARS